MPADAIKPERALEVAGHLRDWLSRVQPNAPPYARVVLEQAILSLEIRAQQYQLEQQSAAERRAKKPSEPKLEAVKVADAEPTSGEVPKESAE